MLDLGGWMLDLGGWMLDLGCCILDTGGWMLDLGGRKLDRAWIIDPIGHCRGLDLNTAWRLNSEQLKLHTDP